MARARLVRALLTSAPLLLAAGLLASCAKDGSGSGSGGTTGAGSGGVSGGSGGATASGSGGGVGSGGTGGAAATGGTSGGSGGASGKDAADGPGVEAGGSGGSGMALPGNGCAGGTCLNPNCTAMGAPAAVGTFAEIGFELRPAYIPNDVIIPTFDDVPDRAWAAADGVPFVNFGPGEWTKKLLDYFDANNMHVDVFINTSNFCDLGTHPECLPTVTRLLKNHNPANHSVHHSHMGGAQVFNPADMAASSCAFTAGSPIVCDDEMKGVETVVNMLSGGARPHLTRFRSPYGEPFQAGMPNLAPMRTLVAKYAVHIGWQMDSEDSSCDDCKFTGVQIATNVERLIGNGPGAGQWGLVLMHGTYPWTYDAVKLLLDPKTGYLKMHNFRVGTVEDAVCWKYGKHSWELVSQLAGQKRDPN